MSIWWELARHCLQHARLCLVPKQTTNKKPANLICRRKRGHVMVKQHWHMRLYSTCPNFSLIVWLSLLGYLPLNWLTFCKCKWSGNAHGQDTFGQMAMLSLLGTINCHTKKLASMQANHLYVCKANVNKTDQVWVYISSMVPLWHEGIFLPKIWRLRQLP